MNDSSQPSVEATIEAKLAAAMSLDHLQVINESGGHNVPPGSETHFKVVLVAPGFESMSRVQRHRFVHEVLAAELSSGVHALAIAAYTPQQWRDRHGNAPLSPPCLGGRALEQESTTGPE
jgi:BolA protein